MFFCKNNGKTCRVWGSKEDIDTHQSNCHKTFTNCENCKQIILRDFIFYHQKICASLLEKMRIKRDLKSDNSEVSQKETQKYFIENVFNRPLLCL